ncbi:MAG TPA: tRNA lysidine(34) synthetase TilS [Mycobacteriales bacterium]|nr:tRNA lysidine(34) synthetase TilS [Mycobacteriales bacterium]
MDRLHWPDAVQRTVLVACSGGADSLALAAATGFTAPRLGLCAGAVVVDHGLQPDSADVAGTAADQARGLGLHPVLVRRVQVTGPGGPEAAARRARYRALRQAAADTGAGWVLLGHTRDDQAETVLLGLGRGSGPRSVAGMRPVDPPWLRPLLGVGRDDTAAACSAAGLTPWRDPHNVDARFTRVRLRREVLPLLEEVLGGGVAGALARTAALLREDLDALDARAAGLVDELAIGGVTGPALPTGEVAGLPAALRGRVLRGWLATAGVSGLTSAHLRAVSALVVDWHGQGPVGLPGGWRAFRRDGQLRVARP